MIDAYENGALVPAVYDDHEFDEPPDPLTVLAGLIAWAGASRARHAVLPVLLGQHKRSQGELARAVVVSRQAIQQAMREGRAEIARLSRGGPF